MPYLSVKVLGDELFIGLQCRDGSGTPTAPSAAPTFRVYTAGGSNVVNGSLPPIERYHVTGLFGIMLPLNSLFSEGRHYIRKDWIISATTRSEVDFFEIVGGGNTGGQHIAMHYLERDGGEGDYLISQLDMSGITINRGPSV